MPSIIKLKHGNQYVSRVRGGYYSLHENPAKARVFRGPGPAKLCLNWFDDADDFEIITVSLDPPTAFKAALEEILKLCDFAESQPAIRKIAEKALTPEAASL